jgi:hypothetical protein
MKGVAKSANRLSVAAGRLTIRYFSETKTDPESSQFVCKIVYDGSCPVCSRAVQALDIKGAELINARGNDGTVKDLEAKGIDLDQGMAVVYPNGDVRVGADAIAAMGEQKGGMLSDLLGSQTIRSLYPTMRAVRNSLIDESIAEQRAREDKETTNRK